MGKKENYCQELLQDADLERASAPAFVSHLNLVELTEFTSAEIQWH
jgi:hypothetical protein